MNLDEAQKEKLVRATPDLIQGTNLLKSQAKMDAASPIKEGANTALPGSRKKIMNLTAGPGKAGRWIDKKASNGVGNNWAPIPIATTAESTLRDNQSAG